MRILPQEDDVPRWAAALKRAGCRPFVEGNGWRASCPGAAHENGNRKNPALSVHPGDGGKVLVKCHVGCAFDEIRHALGMDSGPPPAKSGLVESWNYVDLRGELLLTVHRRDQERGGIARPAMSNSGRPVV